MRVSMRYANTKENTEIAMFLGGKLGVLLLLRILLGPRRLLGDVLGLLLAGNIAELVATAFLEAPLHGGLEDGPLLLGGDRILAARGLGARAVVLRGGALSRHLESVLYLPLPSASVRTLFSSAIRDGAPSGSEYSWPGYTTTVQQPNRHCTINMI